MLSAGWSARVSCAAMTTIRAQARAARATATALAAAALTTAALTTVAACASHDPAVVQAAVRDLMETQPGDWPAAGRRILAFGAEATEPLASAVQATPDSPGAQLAVGLLGRLGDRSCTRLLTDLARSDRIDLAYEAALALGRLGDTDAKDALVAITSDRDRPVRVRVASACSLLDLGAVRAATPILYATLVAGTPFGLETQTELGFADQSRWALERGMVIAAIRRHTGGEVFDLDPESPWPRLAQNAARCRDALLAGAAEEDR